MTAAGAQELIALASDFSRLLSRIRKANSLPEQQRNAYWSAYTEICRNAESLWEQLFDASIHAGFLGGAQINEAFAAEHQWLCQQGKETIQYANPAVFAKILRQCREEKRDVLSTHGGYENISVFRAWEIMLEQLEKESSL